VSRQSGPGRLAPLAIGAVCLALGGLCIVQAARPEPRRATREAWRALPKAKTPDEFAALERTARTSLARGPLDGHAVSLLGTVSDARGDTGKAEAFMRAASRLSHRDDAADLWLFQNGVQARRYDDAFTHLDGFLRRNHPRPMPAMIKVIAAAAYQPDAMPAFARRLAHNPVWRGDFYIYLAGITTEPSAAFPLMNMVKEAGSPPTAQEISLDVSRMAAAGRYDEAYLHWLLFLPPDKATEISDLKDGDFKGTHTPPFGWDLSTGKAVIETASAYGRDEKALRMGYNGFSEAAFTRQLLMLTPGTYDFTGSYLTESPDSAGRFRWTVICAASQAPLVEQKPQDSHQQWRTFSVRFTVPEDGCTAQWLTATALPGLNHVAVGAWYDRLAMSRAPDAQQAVAIETAKP
jgi:hypothetical protein